MISGTHQTFLFSTRLPEDAKKIDAAIERGSLSADKLGPQSYLIFLDERSVLSAHAILKQITGISGEVYWVPLPPATFVK